MSEEILWIPSWHVERAEYYSFAGFGIRLTRHFHHYDAPIVERFGVEPAHSNTTTDYKLSSAETELFDCWKRWNAFVQQRNGDIGVLEAAVDPKKSPR